MSSRGEFCRVLDKYKSGAWDRDKAAAQLEKYFREHLDVPALYQRLAAEAEEMFDEDYISLSKLKAIMEIKE